MGRLFHVKKEEMESLLLGIEAGFGKDAGFRLSRKAALALERVMDRVKGTKLEGVIDAHIKVLTRKGFIRITKDGYVITELGKCALTYCEAMGILKGVEL